MPAANWPERLTDGPTPLLMSRSEDSPAQSVRIVIADDHPDIIDAVSRHLAADCEIVGRARDGRALVEMVSELRPDLFVTDISMPVLNGIDALRRLRDQGVDIPAVVLTVHDDEDLAQRVRALGALGFVLKSRMATDLRVAVRRVLGGDSFTSPLDHKSSRNGGDGRIGVTHATATLLSRAGLLITRSESIAWRPGARTGYWIKPLSEDEEQDMVTLLVRIDPGTHFPPHRHQALEEVVVVEGDLVVEGQRMAPGDYCRSQAGSVHAESHTNSGCILLLKASRFDEIIA